MGIFSNLFKKKYDKYKDDLKWNFDYVSKSWQLLKDGEVIDINDLSYDTKKDLLKRNEDLKNEHVLNTLMKMHDPNYKKTKDELRVEKLESLGYSFNSFEALVLKNEGTLSLEMETLLNELLQEDVLLGIHRVGSNGTMDIVEDVLTNGLLMTGDSGSGVFSDGVKLSRNVSYYRDNKTVIKELMYAKSYKESMGSYLIAIPVEDLSKNIYLEDEVTHEVRLNPKYIVGYVPVDDKRHIESIITLESLKKDNASPEVDQAFESEYEKMINTPEKIDISDKVL